MQGREFALAALQAQRGTRETRGARQGEWLVSRGQLRLRCRYPLRKSACDAWSEYEA